MADGIAKPKRLILCFQRSCRPVGDPKAGLSGLLGSVLNNTQCGTPSPTYTLLKLPVRKPSSGVLCAESFPACSAKVENKSKTWYVTLKSLENTHAGKERLRNSSGNLQIETEDLADHHLPRASSGTSCGWYVESGVSGQVG